ncbi:hypothetical protein [Petrachloros mirabilis]
MSALIIRVITEVLFASSDKIGNLGGQISSSVSELSSALDGIRGAYDGQLEAAVGSRVAQAQGAGNNMAGRVSESSADLARRASAFDAADNASMQDILVGNQTMGNWTGSDLAFTQYGRLQSGSTPMFANYLNLGNLSGAYNSPSAQLNTMVVTGSGFQLGSAAHPTSSFLSLFDKFFTVKNAQSMGRYINNEIIGYRNAGYVGKFGNAAQFMKSTKGVVALTGLGTVLDVVDSGDYSTRGWGVALSKNLIELGIGATPAGEVLVVNAGVQLAGDIGIGGLDNLGKAMDPTQKDAFDLEAQAAETSLHKMDLGNITKDLGAVLYDSTIGSRIDAIQNAFNHPTVANIVNMGQALATPLSSPYIDSNAAGAVTKDLGQLWKDTVQFGEGLHQLPHDVAKLETHVVLTGYEKVTETTLNPAMKDALYQSVDWGVNAVQMMNGM